MALFGLYFVQRYPPDPCHRMHFQHDCNAYEVKNRRHNHHLVGRRGLASVKSSGGSGFQVRRGDSPKLTQKSWDIDPGATWDTCLKLVLRHACRGRTPPDLSC